MPDHAIKYHIVTLGCQMNKSDSERVSTVIEKMGYRWTDHEEEATLLGVLACSVRQKSIDKVYSLIRKWNSWKNNRNLVTFVSGCVLPADKEKFLKLFDLIFPVSDIQQLPQMIEQYGVVTPVSHFIGQSLPGGNLLHHKRPVTLTPILNHAARPLLQEAVTDIYEFWKIKPLYNSSYEAFIPIQNGCDKFCTFCAVPYTRGREVSRPSDEIMDELIKLINKGYKSITLLGQNVNSYGLDKKGQEITFPQLLRRIGELGKQSGKDFWVYFTSPHPRDMTDEVLEVIAMYACLAKQIHLPLQSGDDKVLAKMNRKHTVDDYVRNIRAIRRILPDATLFTDIIVGFTGETDEQFENTRKLMADLKFNMAYIAAYSPRPGAVSSRWKDDVPYALKKQRLHILTEELTRHSLDYNQRLIGKQVKILVTGADRKQGYLSGYTEGRIVSRFKSDDLSMVGSFAFIRVSSASPYAIEGTLIKD